jgi:hypothetical protein
MLNVSEKYKYIWWAPERTGSRKVAPILSYFGFTNQNKELFDGTNFHFNHNCLTNDQYKDYKIICNTRNPYSRVYSLFKNFYHYTTDKRIDSFRDYLKYKLPNIGLLELSLKPKLVCHPNYIIRLEYMREDLSKIPFIYDVLTDEQLDYLTEHGKGIDSWEEFYDQEMKDIVYGLLKDHFEFFGYKK